MTAMDGGALDPWLIRNSAGALVALSSSTVQAVKVEPTRYDQYGRLNGGSSIAKSKSHVRP